MPFGRCFSWCDSGCFKKAVSYDSFRRDEKEPYICSVCGKTYTKKQVKRT